MRLLVVDDDISVRMQLSMALDGVELLEGWRARGVVESAIAEHVDAVVVDRRLPDGDGLDAVRALRHDEATAQLPIVVITANDDPAERFAALSAGADEHAPKPLEPAQFLSLIEHIAAVPPLKRRLRRTVRRARLHVGRDDGGWTDLLAPEPVVEEAPPRKRRRFSGR